MKKAVCWLTLAAFLAPLAATQLLAQQDSVVSTVHNLSASGPGEIRALGERQVCKFCHVPHNAKVPSPLWGRALSNARYEVPTLHAGGGEQPAPQPDGSSRLCLSCHDGTIALGDVAGRRIPMSGPATLGRGSKGYIGTDLSGSHAISFVVPDGDSRSAERDSDMGLLSLSAITADRDVKLDARGKMQCTTCHDPHADRFHESGRVPRFWVKPTVDGVCLTCHTPR